MRSRRKDAYYHRAKAAGYRARSAYKLAELADRFRLLRRGDAVVDLGAWPGSWAQLASERVGPEGRVVAVDVVPLEPLGAPNVDLLVGDVLDPDLILTVRQRLGRPADVVLSDVAPKLTGVASVDEARRLELSDAVLAALPVLLRTGGSLLIKLFMDPSFRVTIGRLEAGFSRVRTARPEATRRGSSEVYVAAASWQGSCG